MKSRTWVLVLGLAVLLPWALVLVGCDAGDPSNTTTSSLGNEVTPGDATGSGLDDDQLETTTTAGDTIALRVYFMQGETMAATTRSLPTTVEVGAAAVTALLEGPTQEEKDAGMVTTIPTGTSYLALSIADGVATVDLSAEYASGGGSLSMFARLAQVVFTLTQFDTIDSVRFKIDGTLVEEFGGEGILIDKPMSREDFEDLSPAILVESPTLGATVSSPLRVTGTANVFEAQFRINIVDWDGLIIADQSVMATSGTGTRGTFDVTIPFDLTQAGLGALIVFDESAEDGSQIDVVEIPLQLTE